MGKKSKYSGKIGVYQIRNILNGMIYVGSSVDIAARWREHKYDLRMNNHRNQHLQNAYNKYGKKAFVYEVLELINEEDKDKQFEKEQYWIDLKEACNKKKGYNIQTEVLIVPKITKKVVCLETKEVFNSLEEAGRAKNIASGSISCCCNKRKLKQTGGYHWRFYDEYINMTEEEIEEAIFNSSSYPFICLDDGKIYKNWKELPYKKGAIWRCCNKLAKGEFATCHGRQYMYLKDYKKLSEESIQKIRGLQCQWSNSGEVVCLETGVVYKNANRARIELGLLDSSGILKCCYKASVVCHGFHWLFKKEYEQLTSSQIKEYMGKSRVNSYIKAIVCLETRKKYGSQVEAAKDTGVSKDMINKICKSGGFNTAKGSLHFVYEKDYENMTERELLDIISAVPKHMRRVKCKETGVIFNSLTEASRSIKSGTTNISKCCKNSKYTCKGYHWEYVS